MRNRKLHNAAAGGCRDSARLHFWPKYVAVAVLLALVVACVRGRPARPAPVPKRPPYCSSVAAVLAHRAELGLTDEQVKKLEQLDDQLQVANATIRNENPPLDRAGRPDQPGARDGKRPGDQEAGEMGGGPGMQMGGGRGMGPMGGRSPNAMGNSADDAAKRTDDARKRMDDNDVKAFLDGEALLTGAQSSRAREIAEQYREQLYEWREATRAQRKGETDATSAPPQ